MTQYAARPGVSPAAGERTPQVDDGWAAGPRRARLEAGTVHVWRADLTSVADDVLRWLSPDESERAARFPDERNGVRWARARGVLRMLLGRYLDVEAATVTFQVDRHGKPSLALPEGSAPVSFNISHSGALALYAFTVSAAVGVDVETARAHPINEVAIAARAFGPDEARRLAELSPAERERQFLQAWVRHEAGLKCGGTACRGNAEAGRAGGGGVHWPARGTIQATRGPEPWLADIDVGAGAAGAIAVRPRPRRVVCWDWRG